LSFLLSFLFVFFIVLLNGHYIHQYKFDVDNKGGYHKGDRRIFDTNLIPTYYIQVQVNYEWKADIPRTYD